MTSQDKDLMPRVTAEQIADGYKTAKTYILECYALLHAGEMTADEILKREG